jgi:hypothetical protein
MGNHDLDMRYPERVDQFLEEIIGALKACKLAVDTTSKIGNMDLAIGGLDKTFSAIEKLIDPYENSIKAVTQIKEELRDAVKKFQADNEDIIIE